MFCLSFVVLVGVNQGPHSIILEGEPSSAVVLLCPLEICRDHFAAPKVTRACLQNLKGQVVVAV